MIVEFERHLRGTNLAENTVKSYLFAVRQFYERYDSVTKRSLKEHSFCNFRYRHISAGKSRHCRIGLPLNHFLHLPLLVIAFQQFHYTQHYCICQYYIRKLFAYKFSNMLDFFACIW